MIGAMLGWWYGTGWGMLGTGLLGKLRNATDFFSLGLLVRTLFEPFRQISAGKVEGSLEARFQAFVDRLISRIIGAIVRIVLLLIGIVLIILEAIVGLALLIIWPVTPFLPLAGVALAIMGVA